MSVPSVSSTNTGIDTGKFIVIEGPEGSGKSTNLPFLKTLIEDTGIDLLVTREPGGTELAEQIRTLVLNQAVTPLSELLLMFAARNEHLTHKIRPALNAARWVLSDRFTDASFAYQGGGRELPFAWVRELASWVEADTQPDWVVVLDVPVSVSIARAKARGRLDRFESESIDFFERVRAAYLQRAAEDPARYTVIDGSASLAAVQDQLQSAWQNRYALWTQTQ